MDIFLTANIVLKFESDWDGTAYYSVQRFGVQDEGYITVPDTATEEEVIAAYAAQYAAAAA